MNICELLTLTSPTPDAYKYAPSLCLGDQNAQCDCSRVHSVPEMVVLVSSSVYAKKKQVYSRFPNCRVFPLLLDWHQLTAEMIKEVPSFAPRCAFR